MKPSDPLKRTPLKRSSPTRTPEERQAHAERALAMSRAYERDRGRCQVLAVVLSSPTPVEVPRWVERPCDGPRQVHHRAIEQKFPELAADVDNLLTLCWRHHADCHANPDEAVALGLLRIRRIGP